MTAAGTLPLIAQWVTIIVGLTTLVSFVIAAVWAYFRVIARFNKIDARFNKIDWELENLRNISNGHSTLTGALIKALAAQGHLSPQDMADMISVYAEMAHFGPIPTNPISPEEDIRLRNYLARARQGSIFTPEEVRDYRAIVGKLQDDHPQDRNIWPLIALGALLLGMFLGGREND